MFNDLSNKTQSIVFIDLNLNLFIKHSARVYLVLIRLSRYSLLFFQLIAIYLGIIFMTYRSIIMYISSLLPSLLLFNGDDDADKSSNNSYSNEGSEGCSGNGSDEDPGDEDGKKTVNDDPEKTRIIERDNSHRGENIMDSLELVDKAKEGDKDALDTIKSEYSSFFDTTDSDKEGLNQVENYLEEEFGCGIDEEAKEADLLDAIEKEREALASESKSGNTQDSSVESSDFKENLLTDDSRKRSHSEEDDFDSKRQRRSYSDDVNNNGKGPGGGFSGPNSSGNGPEANGPDTESPTSSKKIMEVSLGLLILGGGILENIAETLCNLFS